MGSGKASRLGYSVTRVAKQTAVFKTRLFKTRSIMKHKKTQHRTAKCRSILNGKILSSCSIGLCLFGLFACATPSTESLQSENSPSNNGTIGSLSNTPERVSPTEPTRNSQNSEAVAQATPSNPASTPPEPTVARADTCELVESGFGPTGTVNIRVEELVSGLEVPWGIAFVPNGDLLVTERAGQVRLVRGGELQPNSLATVNTAGSAEGGLLGIALHPDFASNRFFYLYNTTTQNGTPINRVERWQLSEGGAAASFDRIILDNIPVAQYHNGGRIRFGPDGMLYVGTGDARSPNTSQNINSLAGKILRLTPEGEVPADNPISGNPAYILGVRNTQGFDWFNDSTLWITDHGPSGDLGLYGHDEVNVAQAGDNLGWSNIYACESAAGMVRPSLAWNEAVPPGGAAIYTGNQIPEWQGSLLIGTLGSEHLQRVVLAPSGQMESHEVYLQGEYGRLREVIMGPDGALYVTTSNCDGRGACPADLDKILRITQ